MTDPTPGLHPAQNRALRELYASARQLADHWEVLATRLAAGEGVAELRSGAEAAHELLAELAEVTASHGLFGRPAAQGVGARVAGLRNALADRTLERNQALRLAVLDLEHVVTLCGYLAALAQAGGDEKMAEFCGRWERNQALRLAVLDLEHVVTLCGYLAALAQAGGDEGMAEFCGRWERKLKRLEGRARKAAIASGTEPDAAIEPLDRGPVGRAGHRLAHLGGTVGEWVDRRKATRHPRP